MARHEPSLDSFGTRSTMKVRDRTLRDPPSGCARGSLRRRPPSLRDEGPAGEPPSPRGRQPRPGSPTSRRWQAGPADSPRAVTPSSEIAFTPERVLMQDFTGVPTVVDLAAMRDALAGLGGDPPPSTPSSPSSSSSTIPSSPSPRAWLRPSPRTSTSSTSATSSGTSSCAGPSSASTDSASCRREPGSVIRSTSSTWPAWCSPTDDGRAFPDTLVGTDSHTTMVNGLGVLGWGVGGIEAEAAMLGQPLTMLVPTVVGLRLSGELPAGTTATDLVLTIAELLRRHGVVGKFVEVHGPGLAQLPLENRATIGNMSPEYGATCVIFPIDEVTLRYLRSHRPRRGTMWLWSRPTPRNRACSIGRGRSRAGLLRVGGARPLHRRAEPGRPVAAPGPHRTRGCKVQLSRRGLLDQPGRRLGAGCRSPSALRSAPATLSRREHRSRSPTATSSSPPSPAARTLRTPRSCWRPGCWRKKAVDRGLEAKPWVKTSLAPGSRVVMDYYERAGLLPAARGARVPPRRLRVHDVHRQLGAPAPGGHRCRRRQGLSVAAVLSGNRNFEGRIHPDVRLNYLASPPLVVAYALAGTMDLDLTTEPLGTDSYGRAGLPARHLAHTGRGLRRHRTGRDLGDVPHPLRRGLRRRPALEEMRSPVT